MKNTMTNHQPNCCSHIQRDLDELIGSMAPGYRTVHSGTTCLSELAAPPVLEISEDGDSYYVEAHIPNVDTTSLKVEVNSDELVISGTFEIEITRDRKMETYEPAYTRASVTFERAITIPNCIDRHNTTAHVRNGVLEIRLPKLEDTRVHMVDVCRN